MAAPRSRLWFPVVALLVATLVPWLLAEGVHIVIKGSQAETSLLHSFVANLRRPAAPAQSTPHDPASQMIVDIAEIEALLPMMKDNGVGLGNSPFSALKIEEASVNTQQGECLEQKPNIHKKVAYLRSNLFNPLDQMSFFVDADRTLPPELDAFLKRYAFRIVNHSTNEFGERTTLPVVDAPRVVLVAGDSVANGLIIDDAETLSSQLQTADSSRRYINLGIARAGAPDITCALERAAKRNHGAIDELVYVLCENDFDQGGKFSDPAALTEWIADFQRRESIARVTLIVSPLIYNTVPEVVRLRGHSHYNWPTFLEERTQVMEFARAKGFDVIDFVDITAAERQRGLSQFAPLALYIDHAHWSPVGVSRVVEALAERPVQRPARSSAPIERPQRGDTVTAP